MKFNNKEISAAEERLLRRLFPKTMELADLSEEITQEKEE